MTRTTTPPTHPTPADRLLAFPETAARLEERGVLLCPGPGEEVLAFENRLGTRLMALYRDTGDPACFEALYAIAGPAVLRWIRGLMTRDLAHLDATELLQDTFVNVFRYPHAFREEHPGSFRVWVRTIAGNVLRRAVTRRPRLSTQELVPGGGEPEDRSAGPSLCAQEGEQARHLRASWLLLLALYDQAYRTLSPRDRRTLQLVEVEGLSYRDAGERLGVARSNMKMIVFRSRKRIARKIRLAMNAAVCRPREEQGAA